MKQTDQQADQLLDLRGVACPMNWVKTKLALEELQPGQLLEVWLDDGDPVTSVARSVKLEGHRVVRFSPASTDHPACRMVIETGARPQS